METVKYKEECGVRSETVNGSPFANLSYLFMDFPDYIKVRSLLCFLAARELGMSHATLAKKLEMSLAGVGFAVESGESIDKNSKYLLMD